MRAYTEQRRLASKFNNVEKRLSGLRTADHSKHVTVDDLTSLIDAQKGRYASILEPRGPAGVRQDIRKPTLRKARNLRTRKHRDDAAMVDAGLEVARESWASPSPEVQRASALSCGNGKVANPWRLLSMGAAAIATVGLAGGLVASRDIWDEAFSSRQTIAIKDANEKPLPRKATWAELRGQIGSVLNLLQSALVNKIERPTTVSQGQQITPPGRLAHEDQGAAIDQGHVPTPPAQPNEDAQLTDAETTAPLPPPAAAAGPASIPNATPSAQTKQDSATAELPNLGYPASAMGEATQRLASAFDDAPPLDRSSPPQHSKADVVDKEIDPNGQKDSGTCYVKVDGRVYVNGACQVFQSKGRSVTFGLAGKPVTVAFDHGRTWTATMGKRQLGKVFKRDSCWGNKQVYICEHAI